MYYSSINAIADRVPEEKMKTSTKLIEAESSISSLSFLTYDNLQWTLE